MDDVLLSHRHRRISSLGVRRTMTTETQPEPTEEPAAEEEVVVEEETVEEAEPSEDEAKGD